MILDHIEKRPTQPTVALSEIKRLLTLLSSAKNQYAVLKQQEQLKQATIV